MLIHTNCCHLAEDFEYLPKLACVTVSADLFKTNFVFIYVSAMFFKRLKSGYWVMLSNLVSSKARIMLEHMLKRNSKSLGTNPCIKRF